ncbi:hypothetical protein JQ604_09705 [Bradyrhizobium jicamae]|uniref:hypothetical protein n=1 Tax=Bradyrhizobium jicamae TaxID=280332 RepID=UPI001BA466E6|nr:hypothetical protein [Bradyrhizobium jicamae]MBR0752460.1 hypothetical protein [Bradyrhizobium jicamae]
MSNTEARSIGRGLAALSLIAATTLLSVPASAATLPDDKEWLMRMVFCQGEGVTMEVYLPQSVVFAKGGMRAGQTVAGYYTLDLTDANKGKGLEPVRITMSADKKFITVNQFTRGLPPTTIPVGGGTVDFDQRFAKGAKCGPFQAQDPDYGNK